MSGLFKRQRLQATLAEPNQERDGMVKKIEGPEEGVRKESESEMSKEDLEERGRPVAPTSEAAGA